MSKQPKGLAMLSQLRREIADLRASSTVEIPIEMDKLIKSRRTSEGMLRLLLEQTRAFYRHVAEIQRERASVGTPGAATSASAAPSASAKRKVPSMPADMNRILRERAWDRMLVRDEVVYASDRVRFEWGTPVQTAHTPKKVVSLWSIRPAVDEMLVTQIVGIDLLMPIVRALIDDQFSRSGPHTVWVKMTCTMVKEEEFAAMTAPGYVETGKILVSNIADLDEVLQGMRAKLDSRVDQMELKGSGWRFLTYKLAEVYFAEYSPPQGGSYVPLPGRYKLSRSLINVRNSGFDCIRYACAAIDHYNEASAKNRTKAKQYDKWLNEYVNPYAALNQPFPCTEAAFARFESDNHCRLFVYCFANERPEDAKGGSDDEGCDNTIVPLRISEKPDNASERTYHMLLIGGRTIIRDESGQGAGGTPTVSQGAGGTPTISQQRVEMDYAKTHFVAIKSLLNLLWPNDHHGREGMHLCDKCLYRTRVDERWELHKKLQCSVNGHHAYLQMPKPGSRDHIVEFKSYKKQLWQPVVCYCDFESLLQKIEGPRPRVGELTRQVSKHDADHIEIQVVVAPQYEERCNRFGLFTEIKGFEILNDGPDFIAKAIKFLFDTLEKRDKMQHCQVAMKPLTGEQAREFSEADTCHICGGKITPVEIKVHDHDHLTGEYRGPAHYACNAQYSLARTSMPVYFHNGTNYDFHLLIHELAKDKRNVIKPIATSYEKYTAVEVKQDYLYEANDEDHTLKTAHSKTGLQFMDTMKHITQSLSAIIEQMTARVDPETGCRTYCYDDLVYTKRHFGDKFHLFAKKGSMPYEWIDCPEKLLQPFPDDIKLWGDCTPAEFERCKRVYQEMHCANMLDFQRHYTRSDVTLLADAFEYYRKTTHQIFGLDPANYLTAPSISWDAMLKRSRVKIENMTDLNMYLMVKAGIRGGISAVVNPYSKANHKYLPDYDPLKPSRFIQYFDATALYPSAMKRPLPIGGYKWITPPAEGSTASELREFIDKGIDTRMYLVDTHTPEDLHDQFNDYPMTISLREVRESELSPYVRDQMLAYGLKPGKTGEKLIPSLDDQTRVLYHAENLKFMLSKGIVITRIHACIEYQASGFMSEFISYGNEMRVKYRKMGLSFMADNIKLISCSVYGKTMEDLTKRTDIRLETDEPKIKKLVSRFNMKSFRFMSDKCTDLVGIEMERLSFVLTKPIMIGFCVLEFSKLHMFRFYYDVLKAIYGDRIRLLVTDTDSLIIEVQTDDIYKDMREIPALRAAIDLASQAKVLPDGSVGAWDSSHEGQYGLFKDECTKVVTQQISETQPEVTAFDCISEYVGIRSKMYDLELRSHKHKGTAKGIGKAARAKYLGHEQYLLSLAAASAPAASDGRKHAPRIEMATFATKKHEISSQVMQKSGLVAINDKRYCVDAYSYTYAYGHYRITEPETADPEFY